MTLAMVDATVHSVFLIYTYLYVFWVVSWLYLNHRWRVTGSWVKGMERWHTAKSHRSYLNPEPLLGRHGLHTWGTRSTNQATVAPHPKLHQGNKSLAAKSVGDKDQCMPLRDKERGLTLFFGVWINQLWNLTYCHAVLCVLVCLIVLCSYTLLIFCCGLPFNCPLLSRCAEAELSWWWKKQHIWWQSVCHECYVWV